MKCGTSCTLPQFTCVLVVFLVMLPKVSMGQSNYQVIDTGQDICYNDSVEITPPNPGEPFYGQDAQYDGIQPTYQDNGDGTVTDLNTGLMWLKSPDRNGDGIINYSDKLYYQQALDSAASCTLAGYIDWRLPTIKELYSLIMFYGAEPGPEDTSTIGCIPFIDTSYFDFGYGDLSAGERLIDAQYATQTLYVGATGQMFGVNFADGRIKGYPSGIQKKYYVKYVRDNTNYGQNQFVDNGDGTITDSATGLMWMKDDNGAGVLWKNALSYAEGFEYAGYTDWRLPNVKELQSIVDYTRSPASSNSAAIDSLFNCTQITNEAGQADYPYYWTGTTLASAHPPAGMPGEGVYFAFGRALGYMGPPGQGQWLDVHGAGAQRSDPKVGDPSQFPYGRGPQGDAVRIYNFVRCVRGGLTHIDEQKIEAPRGTILHQNYPNPFKRTTTLSYCLSKSRLVQIKIYDSSGRQVRTLVNEIKPAGQYQVLWDGRANNGKKLSSGVYFCKLQADKNVETLPVIFIR